MSGCGGVSKLQCAGVVLYRTCDVWESLCVGVAMYVRDSLCVCSVWEFVRVPTVTRVTILRTFLVACTRLYKPLCSSVGPSVGWSVRRSLIAFLRFSEVFWSFMTQWDISR